MKVYLNMPNLGLTMTEGSIVEWKVNDGDYINIDDVMYTIESNKAVEEIKARQAGKMLEILVDAGETVPVGAPVALFEAEED